MEIEIWVQGLLFRAARSIYKHDVGMTVWDAVWDAVGCSEGRKQRV
jgi:hypothetical protein